MNSSPKKRIIGLMSGTSLDGLDIAVCSFMQSNNNFLWEIEKAETFAYTKIWTNKLANAHLLSGEQLTILHFEYGKYLGKLVDQFLMKYRINKEGIDAVSSHGHTIFHQPEKGITLQIGYGAAISETCKLPVVCDFRSQDMALGGQGAPLVPIGDRLLFGEYDFCLNIGGIANISFENLSKRIAWDICPANMILNYLSKSINLPYDKNGDIALSGKVNEQLLLKLNNLSYYSIATPKTLGREWVEHNIYPIIDRFNDTAANKLATFVEHIAVQIATITSKYHGKSLLITGGGARNKFLVKRINKTTKLSVVLPNTIIIDFKEALIFALLGYLKINNRINILSSVTGAKTDHVSGIEYKN